MDNCVQAPFFLWKIRGINSVTKKMSPALFSLGLTWQLRFSRFIVDGTEKIAFILECLNASDTSTFKFRASFHFVKYDGSSILMKEENCNLKDKEWHMWTGTSAKFVNDYGYYCNQQLFSIFSVTILPIGSLENLHQMRVEDANSESACVNSLIADFENLFNNDDSSDFVLNCGEKIFRVHKVVLSARSNYFTGMFRSNMKEANEGFAKIEDLEPDILELVLRYMYTGKVPQLPMESLKKLYAAADMFGVEPLKLKCYRLFVDNFIFSDEGSDKVIKKEPSSENEQTKVLETEKHKTEEEKFLKDLFTTREWRSFSQVFPHKTQEMCRPYLLQK